MIVVILPKIAALRKAFEEEKKKNMIQFLTDSHLHPANIERIENNFSPFVFYRIKIKHYSKKETMADIIFYRCYITKTN
jgi:hypothetical protein